jgi:hypothetical protein
MRGETQATHLEKMMRKHPLFSHYTLTFPPVPIRRNRLKKLQKGDVVLLHLTHPKLQLWQEGCYAADVEMKACTEHIAVTKISEGSVPYTPADSKKHALLLCTFGVVQSRTLQEGMKMDTGTIDFTDVTLTVEGEAVATGMPVWVEETIGIEITKVKR